MQLQLLKHHIGREAQPAGTKVTLYCKIVFSKNDTAFVLFVNIHCRVSCQTTSACELFIDLNILFRIGAGAYNSTMPFPELFILTSP